MGIRAGVERARDNLKSNSFTATGNGSTFTPQTDGRAPHGGQFNFYVSGTFVGTVIGQKSFDDGTTWVPAYDMFGVAVSLTAPGAFRLKETENGVLYRARCSAYTSGTAVARLSQ